MKFRKKPIIIEAIRWSGKNEIDIVKLINRRVYFSFRFIANKQIIVIKTLEGRMTANIGDWIIEGINGEIYPCKNYIFEKTYEKL